MRALVIATFGENSSSMPLVVAAAVDIDLATFASYISQSSSHPSKATDALSKHGQLLRSTTPVSRRVGDPTLPPPAISPGTTADAPSQTAPAAQAITSASTAIVHTSPTLHKMDHPHTLSDASLHPIAPDLLHDGNDMDGMDPELARATATVLANQVILQGGDGGHDDNVNPEDSLLDPGLADKWDHFDATAFYPQGIPSDAFSQGHGGGSHIDPSLDINQQNAPVDEDHKLHEAADGAVPGDNADSNASLGADLGQVTSPTAGDAADPNAVPTGGKRKRARRDPSQPSTSTQRKRPSMIQDPNDPNAHLFLPSNLQGRTVEYATSPLEDTRAGPVYVHPPQGTVQACVRCHGIKRKCEALEWRLRSEVGTSNTGEGTIVNPSGFQAGMGAVPVVSSSMGGVIWDRPRCSGCDKADVPCVFELGAASSG